MPGIYERMNPQLQGALDAALRNRQAYRDRQDARLRDSVGAFNKALPIFGRSIEQALEDTDPRVASDPAYRAARFDYEFSGDRSGLDAIRNRIAQEDAIKEQQAFTDKQRRASELFQAAENDKNRALQQKQQDDNRTTEKARLLANIRTAQAIVKDSVDNEQKYTSLDKAKANSDLALQYDLAEKSGWFTDKEMRKIKGLPEEPEAPAIVVPFKPGYTPEAAPAASEVPAATGTPAGESGNPIIDWKNFKNDAKNAKTLDDIKSLRERAKEPGKQNEGNAEEYNDIVNTIDAKEKEIKNKIAAEAKKTARIGTAKTYKFDKGAVREALDMGKIGGGNKSGKIKFDYMYGGKTYTVDADIEKDGKTAKIKVDGETVQTIPLF
jgi:hypothetical protein